MIVASRSGIDREAAYGSPMSSNPPDRAPSNNESSDRDSSNNNARLQVLQANERTLLAWIRTGLAIMAFGFVVARIGLWLYAVNPAAPGGNMSLWIGAGFLVLGIVSNLVAAQRYVKVRTAILKNHSVLPGLVTILFVTFALAILGGFLLAYLLTR